MRVFVIFTIALTLVVGVFIPQESNAERATPQEMELACPIAQHSVGLQQALGRFGVPYADWMGPDLSDLPPLYRQMALRLLAVPPEERPPVAVCVAPGTPIEVVQRLEELVFGGHLDYQLGTRWSSTAHGGTGGQGDPIILTYSYVPDGVWVPGGAGEPGSANVLFATLNAQFGSTALWQSKFAQCFARWSELTGITYEQENDDGASLFNSAGVLGVRGDVRLCSHNIDGIDGILAYNYYPNGGDMCLDASESWGSSANDYRFFRNVVAHEHGHGFGLAHVCPADGTKLMEPYLNTNFDGPQHDDQRGGQRHYGDRYEDNGSAGLATDLGAIEGAYVVTEVCMDDNSESDYYAFTVVASQKVSLTLTPIGWSYQSGPETGNCDTGTMINSLTINNLDLYLYDTDGTTLLASSTSHPAGEEETIVNYLLPSAGTYYARVASGSTDGVQTYQLTIGVSVLCGSLSGTLSPGTYHVMCDISVDAGDTLRLMPGTTFIFDGYYRFEIYGTILAEGTETDSVIFTVDTAANPDRWHGLRLYNSTSSGSRFAFCLIENGLATGSLLDMYGGGVYCSSSSPTFTNCSFIGNSASRYGGGVYCKTSSSNFANCMFSDNSAGLRGGGLYCDSNSPLTFTNCIFSNNSANDGGGVYCVSSSPNFAHCTFSDNSASGHGGGVACNNSSLIFNSSTIAFSTSEGMYFTTCTAGAVEYCDFYGNSGGNFGNASQGPPGIGVLVTTNANADSCDTYRNIFLDPMFEDVVASDYHLLDTSHCIGAADPASGPPLDFEGDPRPNPPASNPDIGAYENARSSPYTPLVASLVILISGGNAVLQWPPVGTTYNYNIYGSAEPFILGDLLDTVSDTTWTDVNTSSRPSPYFYYVTATE
jgi:predicted outer membrane repeat protein